MSGRSTHSQRRVIVVFADRADCAWLRLLKPGFRHCFVALREQGGWLVFDPLLDRIELAWIEPGQDLDLPSFYAAQGHSVLAGTTRRPDRAPRLPHLTPLTCVSVVKRLLGLNAAWVLTPWQLFRHLTARQPDPFSQLSSYRTATPMHGVDSGNDQIRA